LLRSERDHHTVRGGWVQGRGCALVACESSAACRPSIRGKGALVLIGVPTETQPGETRVAATPQTVGNLRELGHQVVVQAGAGHQASYPDELYAAAGATIDPGPAVWGADMVIKIGPPDLDEVARLRPGAFLT